MGGPGRRSAACLPLGCTLCGSPHSHPWRRRSCTGSRQRWEIQLTCFERVDNERPKNGNDRCTIPRPARFSLGTEAATARCVSGRWVFSPNVSPHFIGAGPLRHNGVLVRDSDCALPNERIRCCPVGIRRCHDRERELLACETNLTILSPTVAARISRTENTGGHFNRSRHISIRVQQTPVCSVLSCRSEQVWSAEDERGELG